MSVLNANIRIYSGITEITQFVFHSLYSYMYLFLQEQEKLYQTNSTASILLLDADSSKNLYLQLIDE